MKEAMTKSGFLQKTPGVTAGRLLTDSDEKGR